MTLHTQASTPDAYAVPVEMVLACSSSKLRQVVLHRAAAGPYPHPTAEVFWRGDRLFGVVKFQGAKTPDLLLPLDVHTLAPDVEPRHEASA